MIGKSCFFVLQSGIEKILKQIENNYIPIMLFSLALLLRSLALNVPYSKYDEDFYVNLATHILENPLNPVGSEPNSWIISSGPVFPYLLALTIYVFGNPYVSTRIVVAIIGSISVVATYFFGKRLFGKTVGTMTGLLMAVNPEHWAISMQVITDIPFFLLFICSLYFIYIGIEDHKNKMLLLGGVLAGLSAITRYPGILILPIFFFYFVLTGRFRYFLTKKVFLSIVIIPSLMLLLWVAYMLPRNPIGVTVFLTPDSWVPRYQLLGNISILLLLGVFPLALFPYIHILKNYFSKKYILNSIVFYVITILILKLLLPEEISLYGVEVLRAVESILDPIHPILFSLAKLFLYYFSILALVGFFIEAYAGTKYKRNEYTLLACWISMILIFFAVLPVSYPRYLLPALPAFLMVISLEIESFSKINNTSKQISYLIFISMMLIFIAVGIYKAFSF